MLLTQTRSDIPVVDTNEAKHHSGKLGPSQAHLISYQSRQGIVETSSDFCYQNPPLTRRTFPLDKTPLATTGQFYRVPSTNTTRPHAPGPLQNVIANGQGGTGGTSPGHSRRRQSRRSRGHTCSYHCGVDTGVENAFHYRVTCGLVVVMDGSFVVKPGCGCQ